MTSGSGKVIVRSVGLAKVFKDFWGKPKAKAVSDLDIEVRQGEIFGLLGPNGAGKSTFVKMLLGLLYPTSGHLSIFGQSPKRVDIKKRIGYLPEETNLYKHLTAEETLDFFGALFNISKAERKERTEQLLKMVGLEHARNRLVGEFSKGMARRIGLAQAMINDPDLLILDEPTNGLDPLGCKEIKELLVTLRERGKTVLVTSHLLSDLEDICDRVVVLYGGRVRAEGELDMLLSIKEQTRVIVPTLDDVIMDKMKAFLMDHFDESDVTVDKPHMSLEDFFLEVINTAQQDHVETDGVTNTGEIADYLSKGIDKSVLDELVVHEKPETEAVVEDEAAAAAPVLDELVKETPSVEEVQPVKSKSFEKSNEKLSQLLDEEKK